MTQRWTDLAEFPGHLQRILGDFCSFFCRRRLKSQIRTNDLIAVVSRNLVAAEAAIGLDQIMTFDNLRCRWPEFLVDTELNNVDVALDTRSFFKSLGKHRSFPEVIIKPLVILRPPFHLHRIIGSVRRIRHSGP